MIVGRRIVKEVMEKWDLMIHAGDPKSIKQKLRMCYAIKNLEVGD